MGNIFGNHEKCPEDLEKCRKDLLECQTALRRSETLRYKESEIVDEFLKQQNLSRAYNNMRSNSIKRCGRRRTRNRFQR